MKGKTSEINEALIRDMGIPCFLRDKELDPDEEKLVRNFKLTSEKHFKPHREDLAAS